MISLNADELQQAVPVPSEFIRQYLPAAPGEYVKVYLYLLMLSVKKDEEVTLQTLAKSLACSEEDIMESLRFWKNQGLLELDLKNERLGGVAFKKIEDVKRPGRLTAGNIKTLKKENKDAAQLIFVSEQYLKRPLSKNDINVLLFFLEDLKLPLDVCEFVVEYCVLKGHPNIRYIEKVGMAWSEKGIKSVREAKEQSGMWDKAHYDVLKAFGINGRNPVSKEVEFIEKWRKQYGFSMPVIAEACGRTVANTGKPSFEYADRILTSWYEGNVKSFKDIEKLDEKHKAMQTRQGAFGNRSFSENANTDTNASRKTYDFKKIADEQKRKEAAYKAYPRLAEIEREVSELSMKKARINLGMSDADDFDLEKKLSALAEERKALLINAGYTPEELSDDT